MDNYILQGNEVLLYEEDICNGVKVLLTNINLVLIKKTKKMFAKEQVETIIYPKEEIKIYNEVPQVKQKDSKVDIFLTSSEITLNFYSKNEAHRFVNTAFKLLTGKSSAARGAEKVKSALNIVDDTLGIDTLETVKNVMENGLTGSIIGGIGKKMTKSAGSNKIMSALEVAKNIIDTKMTADTPKETTHSNDNLEKIKKLKELLDIGAITQEEFEEKKKELLNR